jgi:hypothetical protein
MVGDRGGLGSFAERFLPALPGSPVGRRSGCGGTDGDGAGMERAAPMIAGGGRHPREVMELTERFWPD